MAVEQDRAVLSSAARTDTADRKASSELQDRLTGIADVAVHLDGSTRDEIKLEYAEMISFRSGAHLTVFLSNHVPVVPLPPGPGSAWLQSELRKNADEAGALLESRIENRMSRTEVPWTICRFDDSLAGLTAASASLSRSSDFFLFGRPYGEERHWPELLEAVLFAAEGAAIVVPPGDVKAEIPRRVVVGWRDTNECAHAISASLPFLKAADEVFLVSVSGTRSDDEMRQEPAAAMARHLARHGVDVEIRHLPHWEDPASRIVNEAQLLGADLIVIGAYGHSRTREWIWGGVTRDLLTRSPVPLLLCR